MTFADLSLPQGDAGEWTGTVTDSSGDALDLTGLTVTFILYDPNGTSVLTKTLSKPGGTGVVQLGPLANSDTSSLAVGPYTFKVITVDGSNNQITAEKGGFFLQ